jgi:DNA-binding response OmpR family regulator
METIRTFNGPEPIRSAIAATKVRVRHTPVEGIVKYRFSQFEIDPSRHELRRVSESVHIEPQVFDLILHLVRNRDRIVRMKLPSIRNPMQAV